MARMRGAGLLEAFNPSPCPSPSGRGDDAAAVQLRKLRPERATPSSPSAHGRGDDVATVVQASPLPEGEGQGEGLQAQFVTPAGVKSPPKRPRRSDATAKSAASLHAAGNFGVRA
jgi:hypothetical protein